VVYSCSNSKENGGIEQMTELEAPDFQGTFKMGDLVKKKGSKGQWHGRVVGFYSASCTPIGYAVESLFEVGSVQIYPESALEHWEPEEAPENDDDDELTLAYMAGAAAERQKMKNLAGAGTNTINLLRGLIFQPQERTMKYPDLAPMRTGDKF
jgi:dihydrofolate reductase (trimethoprim resistance protein)